MGKQSKGINDSIIREIKNNSLNNKIIEKFLIEIVYGETEKPIGLKLDDYKKKIKEYSDKIKEDNDNENR